MKNGYTLLDIDLTLFADGGGGAGAGAAAGAAPASGEGANAGTQASANTPSGSGHRAKTGALDNVVYGKQAQTEDGTPSAAAAAVTAAEPTSPAAEGNPAPTKEELRSKYKAFIESPEYKDIHTEEFQALLNRRFKKTNEELAALTEKLNKLSPVIDSMMARYNIQDGDVSKLMAAFDGDQAYWEAAAEEAGMTVEQYKTTQRLMQENARLRQIEQQTKAATAAQQQVQRWLTEAEEAKATYPGFDLDTEYQNPRFVALLKSGVPVKNAYETMHLDEIKHQLIVSTAQTAEKKVVDNLKVKGARPSEVGTSSASGIIVKSDPSKLTKADRAEINRRVARGERISF